MAKEKTPQLSPRTCVNNLNYVIDFCNFLKEVKIAEVNSYKTIRSFLNTKRSDDIEEKWVTTYNDALIRLRTFYRWFVNVYNREELIEKRDWITPKFLNLPLQKTSFERNSPYEENNIWSREELFSMLKYEPNLRNKAIITLSWDMSGRPHELTKLKMKHLDFEVADNYAKGIVPANTKTGKRDIYLVDSFIYCRKWKEQHPHKDNADSPFFYDVQTGKGLKPETIGMIFRNWKKRIKSHLELITDPKEKQLVQKYLKEKKFNPYCLRHSSITHDSDTLPEFLLIKKAGWGLNTKQPRRYIKKGITEEGEKIILKRSGIVNSSKGNKPTPSVIQCRNPKCLTYNEFDAETCSNCNWILSYATLEKIEKKADEKINNIVNDKLIDVNNKFILFAFKSEMEKFVSGSMDLAKEEVETGGHITTFEWSHNQQINYFIERMKKMNETLTEDQINYIKQYLQTAKPTMISRKISKEEWRRQQEYHKNLTPEELEELNKHHKEAYEEDLELDKGKSIKQIRKEERESLELNERLSREWDRDSIIKNVKRKSTESK